MEYKWCVTIATNNKSRNSILGDIHYKMGEYSNHYTKQKPYYFRSHKLQTEEY